MCNETHGALQSVCWLLCGLVAGCGGTVLIDEPDPAGPDAEVPAPDAGLPGLDGGPPDPAPEVLWPAVESAIALDPEIELTVAELVGQMSLAQKVGQMIQAEIQAITPAQVKEYHIGAVLNGGGSWPGQNRAAAVADWVDLADAYYHASMDTGTAAEEAAATYQAIPVLWGTDAVHGHNNVKEATLFPHNIGLGATNDPELMARIAAITAKEVAVTGLDWTFAPTLAVVRDDRWGRTYESYSEDPEIVKAYASHIVTGLQGNPKDAADLFSHDRILATAKHFLGDGGTHLGRDRGDNLAAETELAAVHAQGYLSAVAAGAQIIMASYSSWQGQKMHGNHYLLTEILKNTIGFTGFVLGDWNGHSEVAGCSNQQCAAAINAGVDMIMVPYDWKAFIDNTIAQVDSGVIAMARIDDAVTRILRVKMRSGLLGPKQNKEAPSTRMRANNSALLGAPAHRAVAREAVRKSLVLLKNHGGVLPLSSDMKVLIAGKSADDIAHQSGGWTVTWQGTGTDNRDFPGAQSVFAGIAEVLTSAGKGGSVALSRDGSAASPDYDAAIVVIGETPYAEGNGDINRFRTLEHYARHPEDMQVLETIRAQAPELPIITVFLSGRPLYVNRELNRSDAFVAAWLPGSEGGGIADVLFDTGYDFTGRLGFSWPNAACQTGTNRGDNSAPLFAYGYGLSYGDADSVNADLAEHSPAKGCDAGDATTDDILALTPDPKHPSDYVLGISGPSNWEGVEVTLAPTSLPAGEISVVTVDGQSTGSAKQVTWTSIGQIYAQAASGAPADLEPYASSQAALTFRVRVDAPPQSPVVNLSTHCEWPCEGGIGIAGLLYALADGAWHELSFPVQCFIDAGLDINKVNRPFLLYTDAPLALALEDIRWQPWTAGPRPDCGFATPFVDAIDEPVLSLFGDGAADGFSLVSTGDPVHQALDTGAGNLAWMAQLTPGTSIAIRKDWPTADLRAYDTATARLEFDLMLTNSVTPTTDLLLKVATEWPHVSDVQVFGQVLGQCPPQNQWVSVSIAIQDLINSENDLAPGNYADIGRINELFVIEPINGAADILLDNIYWVQ